MCNFFFLLRAARVPKGPGQFALQSAYHDPHLDVNEMKQQIKNRFVQAKICKSNKLHKLSDADGEASVGGPKKGARQEDKRMDR